MIKIKKLILFVLLVLFGFLTFKTYGYKCSVFMENFFDKNNQDFLFKPILLDNFKTNNIFEGGKINKLKTLYVFSKYENNLIIKEYDGNIDIITGMVIAQKEKTPFDNFIELKYTTKIKVGNKYKESIFSIYFNYLKYPTTKNYDLLDQSYLNKNIKLYVKDLDKNNGWKYNLLYLEIK